MMFKSFQSHIYIYINPVKHLHQKSHNKKNINKHPIVFHDMPFITHISIKIGPPPAKGLLKSASRDRDLASASWRSPWLRMLR